MKQMEKTIYTKNEIIKMFSIHRQTFDKWVVERKLPLIRIGNRKWVRWVDMEKWLEKNSINHQPLIETNSEEIQWRSIWGKR
jgi:predicted DNA-binding transcriptional regulator AlpA